MEGASPATRVRTALRQRCNPVSEARGFCSLDREGGPSHCQIGKTPQETRQANRKALDAAFLFSNCGLWPLELFTKSSARTHAP